MAGMGLDRPQRLRVAAMLGQQREGFVDVRGR
jgi:hypothetical protein